MSALSGIIVSPKLWDEFKRMENGAMIIKISSDSTCLEPDLTFDCSGHDLAARIANVHDHLEKLFPDPAYIVISIKSDPDTLIFISFIPDSATTRQKMLYASSKHQLISELRSGKLLMSRTFSWTELSEVSFDNFQTEPCSTQLHNNKASNSLLQTAINALLRSVLDASVSHGLKRLPSMQTCDTRLNLMLQISPEIESKFDTSQQISTEKALLLFQIDMETQSLVLKLINKNIIAKDLIETLQRETGLGFSPCYAMYKYNPGRYAFIYACPSGSRVKDRIIYAASKSGLLNHLNNIMQSQKSTIDQSIEVGDFDEIDTTIFEHESQTEIEQTPTFHLKISKPKGPRRR